MQPWTNSLLDWLTNTQTPLFGQQRGVKNDGVFRNIGGTKQGSFVGLALSDFDDRDTDLLTQARAIHASGRVVEFDWHILHPSTITINPKNGNRIGKYFSRDIPVELRDVSKYLPMVEERYDRIINEIFLPLKADGIPFLFRPLHECVGGWFWWGLGNSNSAEAVANAHRWMFSKLQSASLTNCIYVFNATAMATNKWDTPARFEQKWNACYPGDEFCHLVSFDIYDTNPFKIANDHAWIKEWAEEHEKPFALSEVGPSTKNNPFSKLEAANNQEALTWYSQLANAQKLLNPCYIRQWYFSHFPDPTSEYLKTVVNDAKNNFLPGVYLNVINSDGRLITGNSIYKQSW
jgi:hypothetical protein